MKALAIFDMDGTLTRGDSFMAFLHFTHGQAGVRKGLFRLLPSIAAWKLGMKSAHNMKEQVLDFFYKGQEQTVLERQGQTFAAEKIATLLRDDVFARLHWHKEQGHEVLLLSASCDTWLAPWCEMNGMNIIASKIEFREGRATGKLEGQNCSGEEKKKRLLAVYDLAQYETIFAYGDRSDDLHYMNLAHHAYMIGKGTITREPAL